MDTIPFQQIRHEANAHCRQSGLVVGCRRAPSVMVLSDEKHFRGELGAHPQKLLGPLRMNPGFQRPTEETQVFRGRF